MNKIKQNIASCTLLLIFSLSFVGCSTTTNQTEAIKTEKPVEIAILMPLTGENKVLGSACDALIKMGISDALKTDVNITSYDASTNKKTLDAMGKIIAKDSKIILGPLYSPTSELISELAKENGIIVITMSNNPTIADSHLFIFGHAPLRQNERIINYFLDQNYKHFISLLPDGQHSKAVSSVMQNMILQKGASLIKTEFYQNNPESIDQSVKSVSEAVDEINELDSVDTKPVIYLSDDQKNLNLVFSSILKNNLDKKAIIVGDNRIDIEYPEPIDIIFTGSLNILNSNVLERAQQIGILHISFLHAMAYDLGRMTAGYIGANFNKDRFLARLNNPEPYYGISGKIHFVDSIAQRKYDIVKRKDGEYKE